MSRRGAKGAAAGLLVEDEERQAAQVVGKPVPAAAGQDLAGRGAPAPRAGGARFRVAGRDDKGRLSRPRRPFGARPAPFGVQRDAQSLSHVVRPFHAHPIGSVEGFLVVAGGYRCRFRRYSPVRPRSEATAGRTGSVARAGFKGSAAGRRAHEKLVALARSAGKRRPLPVGVDGDLASDCLFRLRPGDGSVRLRTRVEARLHGRDPRVVGERRSLPSSAEGMLRSDFLGFPLRGCGGIGLRGRWFQRLVAREPAARVAPPSVNPA